MQYRLPIGVASLLIASIAGGSTAAFELKPSRLEALAARQDLRDEVCIAMADGQLSAWERAEVLADAKQVLFSEEYVAFKRALDRISPPPKKSAARRSAKIVRKHPTHKPRPTEIAKAKPLPEPQSEPKLGPSWGPVIPAGAILPDRMASPRPLR